METKNIINLYVIVVLILIWGVFFWYLYNYSETIRGNPMSFAAKKLDVDCSCTSKRIQGAFMYVNSSGYVSYYYPSKKIEVELINTSGWRIYNGTE